MTEKIIQYLNDNDSIYLIDYQVVGRWVTANRLFRSNMKIWIDDIKIKVGQNNFKTHPILICSKSGAGKTFFVEEAIPYICPKYHKMRVNIGETVGDLDEVLFSFFEKIVEIRQNHPGVAIIVDEFDTPIKDENIYKYFLDILQDRGVKIRGKRFLLDNIVLFFVGSGFSSIKEFVEFAENCPKKVRAKDFLNRIQNIERFDIPSINDSYEEKIVRTVANVVNRRKNIKLIGKKALFYFSMNIFESAHQMNNIIKNTCSNLDKRKEILTFFDLSISNKEKGKFIADNPSVFQEEEQALMRIRLGDYTPSTISYNKDSDEIVNNLWGDCGPFIQFYFRTGWDKVSLRERVSAFVKVDEALKKIKSNYDLSQFEGLQMLRTINRKNMLQVECFMENINLLLEKEHFNGSAKSVAVYLVNEMTQ